MKSWVLKKVKKLELESTVGQALESKELVKIKVELSSVTTTDLHLFNGKFEVDMPIVLGRQGVGVISEIAPDNEECFVKGDRVVVEPFLPCGKCFFCKSNLPHMCEDMSILGLNKTGLFSDFAVVHHSLLHKMPDNMLNVTGLFAEYVSMALNIIDKIDLKEGDHVAILSANKLGYILAQLVTYYQGIAIVIDANDEQLEKIKNENINYTLNPKKPNWRENITSITGGRMCEKVIYLSNVNILISDALDICRCNGTVCVAGFLPMSLTCDLAQIQKKQLTLVSVTNSQGNFLSAINLLATKTVNVSQVLCDTIKFNELPEKMLLLTNDEAKYNLIPIVID